MKGIIFSNFLVFVEEKHGSAVLNRTLKKANASGEYAESKTYPYEELFQLAGNLAAQTGETLSRIFEDFGEFLFGRLAKMFSNFFDPDETLFSFLQKLEDHIHIEVRKKYPDANLPSFDFYPIDDKNLRMIYHSERAMSDFGIGLIKGAATYFDRAVFVGKKDLTLQRTGTEVELLVRILDEQ